MSTENTVNFFIHTPKTSGTTFVDILEHSHPGRIGYFYPPKEKMHEFEVRTKEGPIHHLKNNPDWRRFKFIVGHFTFGIHEILGAENYSYIGVARDPVSHYLSAYKALLRMPLEFQKMILPEKISLEEYLKLDFTHNMQTFFISGLSMEQIRNQEELAFQTCIENIEKHFTAFYLQEMFDEGLIYMKNKLDLKLDGYTKRNVAHNLIEERISPDLIEKIKLVNGVDVRLYESLTQKFNQQLSGVPFVKIKALRLKLQTKYVTYFG